MSAGRGHDPARRRPLVAGLDAANRDVVLPWAESGVPPTAGRLLREGVHVPLRSALPAPTPPGRISATTGRNPGKHTVFFCRGRADAFDLQRVQSAEALHRLRHEDRQVLWAMSRTLDTDDQRKIQELLEGFGYV